MINILPIVSTANEVMPGLYIGGYLVAQDEKFIKSKKIHSIVNVTLSVDNHFQDKGINYLNIKIDDSPDVDISQHFDRSYYFIKDALQTKGRGVLIHCEMGISRSSTILIAFLMRSLKIPLRVAYKIVQNQRNIIHPNQGFMKKLQSFEQEIEPLLL